MVGCWLDVGRVRPCVPFFVYFLFSTDCTNEKEKRIWVRGRDRENQKIARTPTPFPTAFRMGLGVNNLYAVVDVFSQKMMFGLELYSVYAILSTL
jgi:hypothetical protein